MKLRLQFPGGRLRMIPAAPLFSLAVASLPAAEAPVAAPDPSAKVVELPPMIMTTAVRSVPWRYVQIPGFEILSHTSDSTTREFIQGQSRALQLLEMILPEDLSASTAVPRIILLSKPELTTSMSQDLLTRNLSRGNPAGVSAAPARGGARGTPAAVAPPVSARNPGSAVIMDSRGGLVGGRGVPPMPEIRLGAAALGAPRIRYLSNLQIDDSDASATFAMFDERDFDGELLRIAPSGARAMMARRVPALPEWMVTGFMALYNTSQFEPEAVNLAPFPWVTGRETQSLRDEVDYPRKMIPLQNILEGRQPSGPADPEMSILWTAESALFVRWALDGKDTPYKEAFWKYVRRAAAGPVNEDDFRASFGMGYADMRDVLSDYLAVAVRLPLRIKPAKIVKPTVPRIREATVAEVARIKGEWERLEIGYVKRRNPEFAAEYIEQASSTLTKAYGSGERDPEFLAVLGLFYCDTGKDTLALPLLETAVQAKVSRARVYLELARIRFEAALAKTGGADGRLDASQTESIFTILTTAAGQTPTLPVPYELAAEVLMARDVSLSREELQFVDSGLALYPRNLDLLYMAASLKAAKGLRDDAVVLARRALQIADTPEKRARFEALIK